MVLHLYFNITANVQLQFNRNCDTNELKIASLCFMKKFYKFIQNGLYKRHHSNHCIYHINKMPYLINYKALNYTPIVSLRTVVNGSYRFKLESVFVYQTLLK